MKVAPVPCLVLQIIPVFCNFQMFEQGNTLILLCKPSLHLQARKYILIYTESSFLEININRLKEMAII